MATPTKRSINVGPVTWTPEGGTLITIDGIKSANYDEGIEVAMESADADLFNTVAAAVHFSPKITLETINPFQLFSTVGGARGALAITVRDAYNGVTPGGGAYQIVMSHAFLENRSQKNKHRGFSDLSMSFGAISLDGSTHPVAVSAL